MTSVVRIRRKGGNIVQGCDVYIGRRQTQGGWNLESSKWANPYKAGKDGTIQEVLAKYEAYVRSSGLIQQISELRGKELGCWCKPEPCHGDVLVKLLNELDESLHQLALQVAASGDQIKVDGTLISLPQDISYVVPTFPLAKPSKKWVTTKTDFGELKNQPRGDLIYGLAKQGSVIVVIEGGERWRDLDIFRQSNLYSILGRNKPQQSTFIVEGVSLFLNGQGQYLPLVRVAVLVIGDQGMIEWGVAMASDYSFVVDDSSFIGRFARQNDGVLRSIL